MSNEALAIIFRELSGSFGMIALQLENLEPGSGSSNTTPGDSGCKVGIDCPLCSSPMVKRYRRADGEPFAGCSDYPTCKNIVDYDPETMDEEVAKGDKAYRGSPSSEYTGPSDSSRFGEERDIDDDEIPF